jgi:CubicO group peptidase (beta-lactamase class C family)
MISKVLAWVMGVLSLFTLHPDAQPNGLWPTKEFTVAKKPLWLSVGKLRFGLGLKGFLAGGTQTDSLLVLYKGKLVYEQYANGYSENKPHAAGAITACVTSALVGIAIGEGFLGGVSDKVIDYFPEAKLPAGQESKRSMTIAHLLTMTSGIVCSTDADWRTFDGKDVADAALAAFLLPQRSAPGQKVQEGDVAAPSILLGIIARATRRNVLEYAQEKLFRPLGMHSVEWRLSADGLPYGAFGISMTPRDMARFGYLYLNQGRWENRQIVPANWVAQSPPRSVAPGAYGYFFRNHNLEPLRGYYEARGDYGQYIVVKPSRQMVVVRTGSPGPIDHLFFLSGSLFS